ncbi:MAG: hypothetical protein IT168_18580 [Bryobacterales bacterium]|nr:hypothetical protein [Bryobacterales bacterium]
MLWIAIKGAVIGAIYVGIVSYIGTSLLMSLFDVTLNHSRDAGGIAQRALRSRASLFVACAAAFFGAIGGAVVLTFKR